MIKKIICIIMMISLFNQNAYAREIINCDIDDNGVITIENVLPSAKKEKVSLIVYRPNKSFADLTEQTAMLSVAESAQTTSDDNGVYKFVFEIDGESGFYTAQIASESDLQSKSYTFLYSDVESATSCITLLNNASTKDEFYNIIFGANNGYMDLGFYISLTEQADNRKITDFMYDYTRLNPLKSPSQAMNLYKKMYVIELLNEGKLENLRDYEKFLNIEGEACKDFYNQNYMTDDVKKQIMTSLFNRNLANPDAFSDAFLEQVVLKTVAYADGYGRIEEILKAFEAKTGINTSSFTGNNYKAVLGKVYTDYASLKTGLIGGSYVIVGGFSGGGGGGSGSSSKNDAISGNIGISTGLINPPVSTPVKLDMFEDIDSVQWAKEAIEHLAKNEVLAGKEEGKFYPNDFITRAEFTKIIVSAFEIVASGENVFEDVAEDAWYRDCVTTAYNAGIVSGKDERQFSPNENITRQDICVILQRAAKLSADMGDVFSDDAAISDYAKDAVYILKANNIVSGFEDNEFKPCDFATRAQAAAMVYRILVMQK